MAEAVEEAVEQAPSYALEVRAESLKMVSGGDWQRRGESDEIAVGWGGIIDYVGGHEEIDVGGSVTDTVHRTRVTSMSRVNTEVDGQLKVECTSDTALFAGRLQELRLGPELLLAGMSDDLCGGLSSRVTAPWDMWYGEMALADEMLGTAVFDMVLSEVAYFAVEREFVSGSHVVTGQVTLSGKLYQTTASKWRAYWKVFKNGLKNTVPAGTAEEELPPPPQDPTAGAGAAAVVGTAAGGGSAAVRAGAQTGEAAQGGNLLQVLANGEEVSEVIENAPLIEDGTTIANGAELLAKTDELAETENVGEVVQVARTTGISNDGYSFADELAGSGDEVAAPLKGNADQMEVPHITLTDPDGEFLDPWTQDEVIYATPTPTPNNTPNNSPTRTVYPESPPPQGAPYGGEVPDYAADGAFSPPPVPEWTDEAGVHWDTGASLIDPQTTNVDNGGSVMARGLDGGVDSRFVDDLLSRLGDLAEQQATIEDAIAGSDEATAVGVQGYRPEIMDDPPPLPPPRTEGPPPPPAPPVAGEVSPSVPSGTIDETSEALSVKAAGEPPPLPPPRSELGGEWGPVASTSPGAADTSASTSELIDEVDAYATVEDMQELATAARTAPPDDIDDVLAAARASQGPSWWETFRANASRQLKKIRRQLKMAGKRLVSGSDDVDEPMYAARVDWGMIEPPELYLEDLEDARHGADRPRLELPHELPDGNYDFVENTRNRMRPGGVPDPADYTRPEPKHWKGPFEKIWKEIPVADDDYAEWIANGRIIELDGWETDQLRHGGEVTVKGRNPGTVKYEFGWHRPGWDGTRDFEQMDNGLWRFKQDTPGAEDAFFKFNELEPFDGDAFLTQWRQDKAARTKEIARALEASGAVAGPGDEVEALVTNAPSMASVTEAAQASDEAAMGSLVSGATDVEVPPQAQKHFAPMPGGEQSSVTDVDVNAPRGDLPTVGGEVTEVPAGQAGDSIYASLEGVSEGNYAKLDFNGPQPGRGVPTAFNDVDYVSIDHNAAPPRPAPPLPPKPQGEGPPPLPPREGRPPPLPPREARSEPTPYGIAVVYGTTEEGSFLLPTSFDEANQLAMDPNVDHYRGWGEYARVVAVDIMDPKDAQDPKKVARVVQDLLNRVNHGENARFWKGRGSVVHGEFADFAEELPGIWRAQPGSSLDEMAQAIDADALARGPQWGDFFMDAWGSAPAGAPTLPPKPKASPDAGVFKVAGDVVDPQPNLVDGVRHVDGELRKAKESNTLEAARSLDTATDDVFKQMSAAKGPEEYDNTRMAEDLKKLHEALAQQQLKLQSEIANRRAQLAALDAEEAAEAARLGQLADLQSANVKRKLGYVGREADIAQWQLDHLKASPAYKAGNPAALESARYLEAWLRAMEDARAGMEAGEDPLVRLLSGAEAMKQVYGVEDARTLAYTDAVDMFVNPRGLEFGPPNLDDMTALRSDWMTRADETRSLARQIMADRTLGGATVPEDAAEAAEFAKTEGGGQIGDRIQRSSSLQRTANKIHAAMEQLARGMDPSDDLLKYVNTLNASPWDTGEDVALIMDLFNDLAKLFKGWKPAMA